MPQVLKEEVRSRILEAARDVFYRKDYRSAKLTEIADTAGIPVALIYTYFKNKEVLFDCAVKDVYLNFSSAIEDEEATSGSASKRFEEAGEKYLLELLKNHKNLVILMDKSTGTSHMSAKQELIDTLQKHIETGLKRQSDKTYDPMLAHILASNFTEGLLEIARHYKGKEWACTMLFLMTKCYYTGIESL